jgi:uncharacterized glyoxalase superfamily metalloenzyme YdcJ
MFEFNCLGIPTMQAGCTMLADQMQYGKDISPHVAEHFVMVVIAWERYMDKATDKSWQTRLRSLFANLAYQRVATIGFLFGAP